MKIDEFKNRIVPMSQKLYRLAERMLKDIEEAEDMVQDVMMSMWENRQKLSTIFNLDAYAFRIIKNKCLDRLKSSAKVLREKTHENKDPRSDLNKELDLQESAKKINDLVDELPEKQKLIIHMKDIEGYTISEIAEILELKENAVRTNLSRARMAVRERMIKTFGYGTK